MEISDSAVIIPRELLVYGVPLLALIFTILFIMWRIVRAMVVDLKDLTINHNNEMYARHREVSNRNNLVLDRLTDESERISFIELDIIEIKNQMNEPPAARSNSGGPNGE